ncbi:MAG: putative rane protein [Mycobacterium sp.]|nr:putative rane protein [Mycobacterium sp.]
MTMPTAPATPSELPPPPPTTRLRTVARLLLAGAMIFAGLSHLFWGRQEFQAQVPTSVPMDPDGVVMASGGVEIMLGAGLALLRRDRVLVGRLLAAFFVAVFPGNVAQYLNRRDGFGLDSDVKRLVRLLFQPVLIAWALWSTGVPRTAAKSRR